MPYPKLPAYERFWNFVVYFDDIDCWVWAGAKDSWGYGVFQVEFKKPIGAHRFAYEMLVGPIPEGLTLDHLCRGIDCVNPDHMEPVTNEENVRRMQASRT